MRLALLALALAACHPRPPAAPTPPPPLPQTFDAAAVDTWLAAQVKAHGIVGASLAIVQDGKIVLARGYGLAGGKAPVTPDTAFAIGSVTKELTCAAALTLVDDGKLSMQDPVARWYPSLTRAGDITLDRLAAHESGYRDYYPLDYLDARMRTPTTADDVIARYAGLPLDFEPGTRSSYSNTGYMILARIAEKVSGAPLADLLAHRIFAPLGMTRTSIGAPAAGAATGHHVVVLGDEVPTAPEAAGWLVGAGDVWASASDLARWDVGWMDGKVLSDASRRYMATPHPVASGRSTDYGCGLDIEEVAGETVLSHTGEVEGFAAYNAFVPRIHAAVVLLYDEEEADPSELGASIVHLLVTDPTRVPTVKGPSAADAAAALIKQLQAGKLDRASLGDDLSGYLDDKTVAAVAPRLRSLGPATVTVTRLTERGGMEVSILSVAFAKTTMPAYMFRSTDGKIHELLLAPGDP